MLRSDLALLAETGRLVTTTIPSTLTSVRIMVSSTSIGDRLSHLCDYFNPRNNFSKPFFLPLRFFRETDILERRDRRWELFRPVFRASLGVSLLEASGLAVALPKDRS